MVCAARKVGFVDAPGERKSHDSPIPPVGGLALFPVFILFAVIFTEPTQKDFVYYAGLAMLVAVGAFDDYKPIAAWIKFFVQIAVASLVVVVGGAKVHYLGDLFGLGEIGLGPFAIPFSITATVLLINSINLLDGLDGLSGGVCLVILLALSYGIGFTDPSITLLIACLLGFLTFNARIWPRRKAAVFIGDAGSLALGLTIAWFGISYAGYKDAAMHPMVLAWILAFPIYDTCGQFGRRMKEGRHPFSPDHNHFHHQLIKSGFSVFMSVAIIWLIVLGSSLFGILTFGLSVPLPIITIVWIAGILAHIYMCFEPSRYETVFKLVRRPR
jgi:UDP-GlcNAc:undecaprenyl-phosphate GlcNAc-1-phosphate transferase